MMNARRLDRCYKQTLFGDINEIFSLLCPVREKEWLDGWDYRMIFSKSGLAENGCIFETDNDFGSFQWIMTRYDNETKEVQFVKVDQNHMIVIIDLSLTENKDDSVTCYISYRFTALNDDVVQNMILENSQEEFNRHMSLWEDSLNYFLKTGKMLK